VSTRGDRVPIELTRSPDVAAVEPGFEATKSIVTSDRDFRHSPIVRHTTRP
jgi:hypothetical protein